MTNADLVQKIINWNLECIRFKRKLGYKNYPYLEGGIKHALYILRQIQNIHGPIFYKEGF
jgi:hypothetical protein